ncbi:MAG: ParB N-terminal domain-containing protein [Candidatus Atribacteria bacterium]|nr:ParB N-terminal domain-containing protein [Candidatus Atribacteria bacterium]
MSQRIEEIPLSEFDLSLSEMRVMNMSRIIQVEKSMRLYGQLQPVVACFHEGTYQLIDGFKRCYADDLHYNLVKQKLHGNISCESEPEKGVLFKIDVPVK